MGFSRSHTARNTAILGLLALFGCADEASREGDTGVGFRDATIVDGGVALDGAGDASADAGASDAAALDGGTWCASGTCDPMADDACGDGGTCVLGSSGPFCSAEIGEAREGARCESTNECGFGLGCFRTGGRGVCSSICCPGDSCGEGMRCGGAGVLVDGSETDFWHCVGRRTCDVLAPGLACEPQEGCYIISADGETDCRRAGLTPVGEPCIEQSDCGAGLFCGGLVTSTCSRICSLGDGGPGGCPEGEGTCRAYSHSPRGTGVCTLDVMTRL